MELESQAEVLVEDELRYLRRQKPLEIKRRKLGQRVWKQSLRILLGVLGGVAAGWLLYQTSRFLLFSPFFLLTELNGIEVSGIRHVARAAVLEKFAADQGRSIVRVPLEERRRALEEIPWVERATCQRVLPDRLRVEVVERKPVGFLRWQKVGTAQVTELALVDAYGVILERPLEGEFRFPVVTGIGEGMPREQRELRLRRYVEFLNEVELARPGASDQVSEVDLADATDLRVTLTGLPELGNPAAGGQASVLVHFGTGDFHRKFRIFAENIGHWRAAAGRVESVDLRFEGQVVVNPESASGPAAANRLPGVER